VKKLLVTKDYGLRRLKSRDRKSVRFPPWQISPSGDPFNVQHLEQGGQSYTRMRDSFL